jgi:hypothetical protein
MLHRRIFLTHKDFNKKQSMVQQHAFGPFQSVCLKKLVNISVVSLLNPSQFACKNGHFCWEQVAICFRAGLKTSLPPAASRAGR